MEHERGAFKVNSPDMLGAVKKSPEISLVPSPWRPPIAAAATKCRAVKLDKWLVLPVN
jgi:hypothetical protein